jgi:hypothetical protein
VIDVSSLGACVNSRPERPGFSCREQWAEPGQIVVRGFSGERERDLQGIGDAAHRCR